MFGALYGAEGSRILRPSNDSLTGVIRARALRLYGIAGSNCQGPQQIVGADGRSIAGGYATSRQLEVVGFRWQRSLRQR